MKINWNLHGLSLLIESCEYAKKHGIDALEKKVKEKMGEERFKDISNLFSEFRKLSDEEFNRILDKVIE